MTPSIGLFGVNMGPAATADGVLRIGTLAEELGYDSLWAGEHLVVPSPRVPPSIVEPDFPLLDPLVTLAALAAVTERVRLATGIVILPQRNPVVLAKELASLDVMSGGRLVFGMGVGYVEPEMRAVGVPMEGRGARADEYLAAMRSLWQDEAPTFDGEHVRFDGVDAHPRPLQRPLPVVSGGHTPAAFRRAVRHSDGWYGFLRDRRQAAEDIAGLRREAAAAGRSLEGFEITVSPAEPLTPDVVAGCAALGVTRLVLVPPAQHWGNTWTFADFEAFVRENAPRA